MFCQTLKQEIGLPTSIMLYTDASAAQGSVLRTGLGRLKHLDMKNLWLQQEVQQRRPGVSKITDANNASDLLTKVMDGPKFLRRCQQFQLCFWPYCHSISMLDSYEPPVCPTSDQPAEAQISYQGQVSWHCRRCHRTVSWNWYRRGQAAWQAEQVGAEPEAEQAPMTQRRSKVSSVTPKAAATVINVQISLNASSSRERPLGQLELQGQSVPTTCQMDYIATLLYSRRFNAEQVHRVLAQLQTKAQTSAFIDQLKAGFFPEQT